MSVIKSIYRIDQCIAETTLSKHYIAQSLEDGQNIYIVAYLDDFLSQEIIDRLIQVLDRQESISHPVFLPVIDYHYDGDLFYVMYSFSQNLMGLDVYLSKQEALNGQFVRSILTQVLDGLYYLSSKSITYSHLSLESIYLTQESKVQLLAPELSYIILSNQIGKLPVIEESVFLAPEALLGVSLDDRADCYSFGVLMYFLYTGKWPYPPHQSLIDCKTSRLKPFPDLLKERSTLPKSIPLLVSKSTAPSLSDRFDSMSALYKAFHSSQDLLLKTYGEPMTYHQPSIDIQRSLADDRRVSRKAFRKKLLMLMLPVFLMMSIYYSYRYFTGTVETVRVPNLLNRTYAEASKELRLKGLNSHFSGERFHPSIPKGMIVETKPIAGRDVKTRRVIKLYISKGPRTVVVEDYRGLSIELATSKPSAKDISFDIIDEQFSIKHASGSIISQSVTPNGTIGLESPLDVVISKGVPVQFSPILADDEFNDLYTRFNLSFWIPDYFHSTYVSLIQRIDGVSVPLFSYYFFRGERQDLSFYLEKSSQIELYYDQKLVFERNL